jgi:hypothetical protein
VRDAGGVALPGEPVFLVFNSPSNVLCGTQVFAGVTDGLGQVQFVMSGGGCGSLPSDVEVWATTGPTLLRTFMTRSPDFDGGSGDLRVTLADLLEFSNEFRGISPDCHDYNRNGRVDVADVIIFAGTFTRGASCAP